MEPLAPAGNRRNIPGNRIRVSRSVQPLRRPCDYGNHAGRVAGEAPVGLQATVCREGLSLVNMLPGAAATQLGIFLGYFARRLVGRIGGGPLLCVACVLHHAGAHRDLWLLWSDPSNEGCAHGPVCRSRQSSSSRCTDWTIGGSDDSATSHCLRSSADRSPKPFGHRAHPCPCRRTRTCCPVLFA